MLLLADAWLHDLDPFAIQIGGFVGELLNGGIRWYGLSYLAGFAIGFLLIKRVLTVGVSPLKPTQAMDLVVTLAIAIVIGGRLGYVVFYQPSLFLDFTGGFPFWGVLKINQGGMASHGGILGGAAGCLFFAWRQKMLAPGRSNPGNSSPDKTLHLVDLMAFGAPLGLLMGRIANFINGELIGRACSPSFPLAVKFPQEIAETWTPEQIDELRKFAVDEQGVSRSAVAQDFPLIDMAIQKVQAHDPAWTAYLAEHLTTRYPSQLFAGLTEGVVVFAVLLFLYRKPVKPGLIASAFCITYAIMRVVNEFFRRPDAEFIDQDQLPTITHGQLLSIGIFVLGIAGLTYVLRSKNNQNKLGGWMKRAI